ncbi:hypothetical protein [Leptospirillum ferrooxidans]|uniref:Uncharacterized protein n=1 Tax=Leptospirillum ferrooxidans (strain C2-3) TaxID=1162668 RepID=I0IRK8_LEPFC|nr:hypothetical protein [Leptospirillum ferrooxidans]BAM07907.1 hypothetical protein LFE_2234 [Leptospirillum ferrooxidans C2-3]
MLGPIDEWLVTDLNPRLGAGSSISYMVGSDFFGATIQRLMAPDASIGGFFKEFTGQAYVVRQYSDFVTEIQK